VLTQAPPPIVVDVIKQPAAARDISVDAVLGIFALTGAFLVAALVVALLGGGTFVLYRRFRDAKAQGALPEPSGLGLSTTGDDPRLSRDAHLGDFNRR
jgi:hypothetical protein